MIQWSDAKKQVRENYIKLNRNSADGYTLSWVNGKSSDETMIAVKFFSLPDETELRVTYLLSIDGVVFHRFSDLLDKVTLPDFLPATIIQAALAVMSEVNTQLHQPHLQAILDEIETVGTYLISTPEDLTRATDYIERMRFKVLGSFYYTGHTNGRETAYIKIDFSTENLIEHATHGKPDAIIIAYVCDPAGSGSVYFSVTGVWCSDDNWKSLLEFDALMDTILKHYERKPDVLPDLSNIYRKFKITQLLKEME